MKLARHNGTVHRRARLALPRDIYTSLGLILEEHPTSTVAASSYASFQATDSVAVAEEAPF